MRVEARHLSGFRFELRSGDKVAVSDQRAEFGGEDTAPMPSEFFLFSVAACFGQAVAHVARKMREPLADLRLAVEGEKDARAFRFRRVAVTVEVSCQAAKLPRIIELARQYCFITNSLAPDIEVAFTGKARP